MVEKAVAILMVLLLVVLTGCSGGSYVIGVGEINVSQQSLTGEYNSFSGHYFKKVKIVQGEALNVAFSAVTEKGDLLAKVIDDDGKVIETLAVGDQISIKQPGQYKLQVEGEKHKGSFTLSWETE